MRMILIRFSRLGQVQECDLLRLKIERVVRIAKQAVSVMFCCNVPFVQRGGLAANNAFVKCDEGFSVRNSEGLEGGLCVHVFIIAYLARHATIIFSLYFCESP